MLCVGIRPTSLFCSGSSADRIACNLSSGVLQAGIAVGVGVLNSEEATRRNMGVVKQTWARLARRSQLQPGPPHSRLRPTTTPHSNPLDKARKPP